MSRVVVVVFVDEEDEQQERGKDEDEDTVNKKSACSFPGISQKPFLS